MVYQEIENEFNISTYLLEDCNIKLGRGNKVAIYFKDEIYTYNQVNEFANKVSNYLQTEQLEIGDKIGIYMNDCPEFIFLLLGAIKAGIIPVIINSKLEKVAVDNIIKSTGIKILFTGYELEQNHILEESDLGYRIENNEGLIKKVQGMSSQFETIKTTKDDIAVILFTSGSSGKPKGVMHSHINFYEVINDAGKYVFETKDTDVFYCHSSMSFAFGLGATLYLPFAEGASTVLNDDDSVYEIAELVEKYSVTEFIAVPSVYLSLLQLLANENVLFSKCRKFIASGEPLSKRVSFEWKEKVGMDIISGFGQTETLHLVIANMDGKEHYGSLGRVLPNYEVKVLSENGEPVKTHEIGEMFIKGPGFMCGYWDNSKLTEEVLSNGWLKTGDMVYIDEQGFIWYSGRNSDTFKVNGVWQSALPIEEIILEQENVLEVIVCNEFSEEHNSEIVAYLALKDFSKNKETIANIRKLFFQKRLRTLCPKKFNLVEELPKGTTGKLKRGSVRETEVLMEI